jgi:NDP-sugar pyrophosphorylase family protein
MSNMDAVVMCGGKGERMGYLTKETPKPLLEVNGKPILDYTIEKLMDAHNVDKIILNVNEKFAKMFIDRYGYGTSKPIEYSIENLGSFTVALQQIIDNNVTGDAFLLTLGDTLSDLNFDVIIDYYNMYKGKYDVIVVFNKTLEKNTVITDGKIVKKMKYDKINTQVASGIHIFNKKDISGKMGERMDSAFPLLISQKKLIAYKYYGFVSQANTYKDIEQLSIDLKNNDDKLF